MNNLNYETLLWPLYSSCFLPIDYHFIFKHHDHFFNNDEITNQEIIETTFQEFVDTMVYYSLAIMKQEFKINSCLIRVFRLSFVGIAF